MAENPPPRVGVGPQMKRDLSQSLKMLKRRFSVCKGKLLLKGGDRCQNLELVHEPTVFVVLKKKKTFIIIYLLWSRARLTVSSYLHMWLYLFLM